MDSDSQDQTNEKGGESIEIDEKDTSEDINKDVTPAQEDDNPDKESNPEESGNKEKQKEEEEEPIDDGQKTDE